MTEVLKLYKTVGETPLECIRRFRADHPDYKDTNMTYLGRLDPMAEGLLLVLAGNTKDKDTYLGLDKTYEFEVLWGFTTDTYDALGKAIPGSFPKDLEKKMPGLLEKISRMKTQKYPPYSSRTVGGTALFSWARSGRIDEIDIPERGIKIFNIKHRNTRLVSHGELLESIIQKVSEVKGNFRQAEILKSWRALLEKDPAEKVLISAFAADVSGGTYIRGIAHEMGKLIGSGALAYSIKRTRVGEYRM